MKQLHDGIKTHKRVLLHGLTGVGKSTIATEYIRRHRDAYKRIVYFNCPFEDDSLENMFDLLTQTNGQQSDATPPPSILPWLRYYSGGLVVIDVGGVVLRPNNVIVKLLNALLKPNRKDKAHVLIIARTVSESRCPVLRKIHRVNVGDLQTEEASQLARRIVGSNWVKPFSFSEIVDYGYGRPAVFKHLLTMSEEFSEIISRTRQLRQRAALGRPLQEPMFNSILKHQTFHHVVTTVSHLRPGCVQKLVILAFLSPSYINTKLAKMLFDNWSQNHPQSPSSSPRSSSAINISRPTDPDFETWEDTSIIEWNTSAKNAFSLDPYIQIAMLYKYCCGDSKLGRMLWDNTRTGLEKFAKTVEIGFWEIDVAAHLKLLLSAKPSVLHEEVKFLAKSEFPTLREVYGKISGSGGLGRRESGGSRYSPRSRGI
jgi:hypothetical protein